MQLAIRRQCQSSSIDAQVFAISGLRLVLWTGGIVVACPAPITFSSVCGQTEAASFLMANMPAGFALWVQGLGAVYDVLDQALRLFLFGCRRFFSTCG